MKKRTPTLPELVDSERQRTNPNPFIVECMSAVIRANTILDEPPPHNRIDEHSACASALVILTANPTHDNLKAMREAIEDFETGAYRN